MMIPMHGIRFELYVLFHSGINGTKNNWYYMEYVLNFMFYSIVVSMAQLIMIYFIIIFSGAVGMSTALTTPKLDTDLSLFL